MIGSSLRTWYRRWQVRRDERRRRHAEEHQQAVYVTLIARWERKHWWRFVPPEGWRVGYNTAFIPYEAYQQIRQHGRILPISLAEIHNATGVPIPFIRSYYQHGR